MDLQPVRKNEIEIGKPLPWPVFDKNKNLLLKDGFVVQTQRQLELLIENGLFRDPRWHRKRVLPPKQIPEEEEKPVPQAPQAPQIAFSSIKFAIGDTFQMQPVGEQGQERHYVKLIGYADKRSLLVTTPMQAGEVLLMREGQPFVLRGFSGKSVYAFNASILRVCNVPYPYLHLSYPTSAQGLEVRKAQRVKVNVIASAWNTKSGDGATKLPCMVVDMSMTGAQVDARFPLGEASDLLNLALRLNVSGTDLYLTLPTTIRAVRTGESAGGGEGTVHHGVEFQGLELQDRLAIQNFIYQNLVEGL
jgi:c-di-GMP-binding flagellar brake protein YcgR